MIDRGKHNLLGVLIDAVDYEASVEKVICAAHERRSFTVSALAVHGVMTGVQEPSHGYRLNHLDLVVPDGQPVRWALNLLHKATLPDRVYGPTLTLKVCERAAREGLPVYLYGSMGDVLAAFRRNLCTMFPGIKIAGEQSSKYRQLTPEEKADVVRTIEESGARILLVGLGCPRQEVWVYEHRDALHMPMLAVGAAFDFHAGRVPQAPPVMQKAGLEWLYRLCREPARLWKRYLLLNPEYVALVALQWLRLRKFPLVVTHPPRKELRYG